MCESHLQWPNSERQKIERWPSRPRGRGNGKLVLNGYGVSFGEDEKLLEVDGGGGCPRTCTLKCTPADGSNRKLGALHTSTTI